MTDQPSLAVLIARESLAQLAEKVQATNTAERWRAGLSDGEGIFAQHVRTAELALQHDERLLAQAAISLAVSHDDDMQSVRTDPRPFKVYLDLRQRLAAGRDMTVLRRLAEGKEKPTGPLYVTTTEGSRGHYAVLVDAENGEPIQTGSGSYEDKTGAEAEARDWAEAEGLEFRP